MPKRFILSTTPKWTGHGDGEGDLDAARGLAERHVDSPSTIAPSAWKLPNYSTHRLNAE
jgi:hypothetical protein